MGLDPGAHFINGHTVIGIIHRIIGVFSPATELHAIVQASHARVVENSLVSLWISSIGSLHKDRYYRAIGLVEVHFQAGACAAFSHDIDGERLGGEGDLAVLGGDGGHELVAVGALVIDVQILSIGEVSVGNGHHHRLAGGGLPSLGTILDGDVIGTLHLLALNGRALHLGHRDLGGLGHLTRHRDARSGHLFGNRTVSNRTLILRR